MQFDTDEKLCRLSRRNLMKAGAVSLAALGMGAPSAALSAEVGRISISPSADGVTGTCRSKSCALQRPRWASSPSSCSGPLSWRP
jgi:hypothetical protein